MECFFVKGTVSVTFSTNLRSVVGERNAFNFVCVDVLSLLIAIL